MRLLLAPMHPSATRRVTAAPGRRVIRAMVYCAPSGRIDAAMLHNSVDHYENFPVASILLPRRLRRPVQRIYWFARSADDFADEGERSDAERLALLDGYRDELARIERNQRPESREFVALAAEIHAAQLPVQLFRDLLDAFAQDVTTKRYADFGELMQYCRRSANPIGRLLLHLYSATDERNLTLSDAICSSLQIINFLQDIVIDYDKGRIYMPEDEMRRFRVTENHIAQRHADGDWQAFMLFQIERARRLLNAGAPLVKRLPGRLGWELRLIVTGGETILRKLHRSRGDVFMQRPQLTLRDWPSMAYRAFRY